MRFENLKSSKSHRTLEPLKINSPLKTPHGEKLSNNLDNYSPPKLPNFKANKSRNQCQDNYDR